MDAQTYQHMQPVCLHFVSLLSWNKMAGWLHDTNTCEHIDVRTHVRTYIWTYLCLFRSKDCSLQGNTDHVHTEVNGVHHCTVLLGLQGVGGGASERHALSYTWRESHTHCSAPFCPSPFSR